LPGTESTNISLNIGDEKVFVPSFLPGCPDYNSGCEWSSYHLMRVDVGELVPSSFVLGYGGNNADVFFATANELAVNVQPGQGAVIETFLKFALTLHEDRNLIAVVNTRIVSSVVKNPFFYPTSANTDAPYWLVQEVETVLTDMAGELLVNETKIAATQLLEALNYTDLKNLEAGWSDTLTASSSSPILTDFFAALPRSEFLQVLENLQTGNLDATEAIFLEPKIAGYYGNLTLGGWNFLATNKNYLTSFVSVTEATTVQAIAYDIVLEGGDITFWRFTSE
jgi:hypothetical protein